jgi:hypothetical protein
MRKEHEHHLMDETRPELAPCQGDSGAIADSQNVERSPSTKDHETGMGKNA